MPASNPDEMAGPRVWRTDTWANAQVAMGPMNREIGPVVLSEKCPVVGERELPPIPVNRLRRPPELSIPITQGDHA